MVLCSDVVVQNSHGWWGATESVRLSCGQVHRRVLTGHLVLGG